MVRSFHCFFALALALTACRNDVPLGGAWGGPSTGGCPAVPGGAAGAGGTPVAIAETSDPGFLLADAADLYVAADATQSVYRVPLDGGPSVAIESRSQRCLAMNATNLYMACGDEERVTACPRSGCDGGSITLAVASASVTGVAADDSYVYWTLDGETNGVWKVPVGGGAPTQLSDRPAGPIAVGGGQIVFGSAPDPTPTVFLGLATMPVGGGTPEFLVPPGGLADDTISAISIDCANVYYGTNGGSLMKIPLAGGAPVQLAYVDHSLGQQLAVDADRVYFLADGPSAWVESVPVGGGPVSLLAPLPTGSFRGIAVDPSYVYFSTVENRSGHVWRLAK